MSQKAHTLGSAQVLVPTEGNSQGVKYPREPPSLKKKNIYIYIYVCIDVILIYEGAHLCQDFLKLRGYIKARLSTQHYKNQRLHNYMLDIQIYAHLYTMIKSVICIDSCFGRKNRGKNAK